MSKAAQKVEIKDQPPAVAEANALLSMIERAARDPAVDIDKMQRLFQMQQEAETRRSRVAFLAAFSALQKDLPAIERKGTGHNDKKYARFEDVITAVKPKLAEHGFSLSFRTDHQGTTIKVTGVLGHEAGHQEETALPLPADTSGNKNAVQSWGSSISYAKRYVALTLLGVATEDEDDDGKKAGAGELITDVQAGKLKSLVVEASADIERFTAYMKVERIEDIPAARFAHAVAMLNKKRGQP